MASSSHFERGDGEDTVTIVPATTMKRPLGVAEYFNGAAAV